MREIEEIKIEASTLWGCLRTLTVQAWLTVRSLYLSLILSHKLAKSLELFMQSILEETLKQARERGSRKLTPIFLYV